MARERSILVDENDNIIGSKFRDELVLTDRYRIVAVWIENSLGQALIAQRALHKKLHPGLWGPAAAGGVEYGESYEEAAYKELKEEIGLDTSLEFVGVQAVNPPDGHNRMCGWYKGFSDKKAEDFVLETDVSQVKWVDKATLFPHILKNSELYTSTSETWPKLFS